MSKKNIKELLLSSLIVIGGGTIILLFFMFYGGGRINRNNVIDEKAFSFYAGLCNVAEVPDKHPNSTNFIEEATKFDLFSKTHPKVLVIDSKGVAYKTREGLGGDWNPQFLYDVQLVVCVGEEHSAIYSMGCNGNTYQRFGRTLNIYEAKTGKWKMSEVLTTGDSEDECSDIDRTSLEFIKQDIESWIIGARSNYQVVP